MYYFVPASTSPEQYRAERDWQRSALNRWFFRSGYTPVPGKPDKWQKERVT